MNNKNWLFAFIGATTTIVILMIVYLLFDIHATAKDFVPAIVTGVVSLFALYFGYRINSEQQRILEKQQRVQIKTTIEKEWVENVRKYLAEIIAYFIAMDSMIHNIKRDNQPKDISQQVNYMAEPDFRLLLDSFTKNRILLSLYLNFNNQSEKYLYKLTSDLWNFALRGENTPKSSGVIEEMQSLAHNIFDEKLNGDRVIDN